jgi:succinate-acetate transporter protein
MCRLAVELMVRPITVPQFGIREAYAGNESELSSALGIYLASWFIVTFIFFVATWKASIALSALFFFLDITFLLLMCADFTGKSSVHTAGGALGIITAFIAFYIALAGLLTKDTSYFSLPVGDLSRASTPKNSN